MNNSLNNSLNNSTPATTAPKSPAMGKVLTKAPAFSSDERDEYTASAAPAPVNEKKKGADSKNAPFSQDFRVEDVLHQIKIYAQVATRYIQKRPLTFLTAACMIGIVGAWILSPRKSNEESKA